jgi:hypothetical protein
MAASNGLSNPDRLRLLQLKLRAGLAKATTPIAATTAAATQEEDLAPAVGIEALTDTLALACVPGLRKTQARDRAAP